MIMTMTNFKSISAALPLLLITALFLFPYRANLCLAAPFVQSSRQTPTAYTTGGGGFYTMTDSMGIIRAWYESNILEENTTHFGGGSGGTWFQVQFSYSKEFYDSAIGSNGMGVPEFVTMWGTRYGVQMKEAIESGLYEDLRFELVSSSEKCALDGIETNNLTATEIITGALDDALESLYFPANNWLYYINAMLVSYISDTETSNFGVERDGFPKGKIVLASSLGPDIYQDDPALKSPKLNGAPDKVTLFPISYVAKEGDIGEWNLKASGSEEIEISIKGNTTMVPFTSLPILTLSEVASASSSFLGSTGSPTLFKNTIKSFLKDNTDLKPVERTAVQTAIDLCLPLGLQNTSSPTEGNIASTITSWSPMYRYIDGGYTDGSSITHTIAEMQNSCLEDPGQFDCETNGLRLLNIVGNSAQNTVEGEQNAIPRLFANCDCGTTTYQSIGNGIDPQIFAEDFPTDLNDDSVWYLYSTKVYEFGNNTEPSNSYALRMNVTTVDNTAYGVTGGTTVDIIILFPDLPPQEKEIWPGYEANYAFSTIYAKTAQEQYASTLQLFNKWDLADAWGTGQSPPPTSSPTPSPTPLLSNNPTKKSKKPKTLKKKSEKSQKSKKVSKKLKKK